MARGEGTDDTRLTGSAPPAVRARRAALVIGAAGAVLLAGCGSATVAELPPPAGPDRAPATTAAPAGEVLAPTTPRPAAAHTRDRFRDGSLEAVLDPRARELAIIDTASGQERARVTVGVGPTQVRCAPQGPCFVVDTQGDALLVVRVGAEGRGTSLTRRVYVAGAPYGIAIDPERRRLWLTLTARNELAEFGAHGRPHLLSRHPTIRQPDVVTVDPSSGDVTIVAPDGARQRLPDPASPDR